MSSGDQPKPEKGDNQESDSKGSPSSKSKTSDFYRTQNIPKRFDNPSWFQGYGLGSAHPMYRTSAREYGSRPPSVHTMPTTFNAKSQKFTEHLGKCGMYRNHSLNTAMDQSKV
ncbi:PREDICTED: UPF0691 protein C9orf116 homolog [Priapulus caudatus]|uniref:UPF0691 protein C9orf116 homolog n=1 Tax=Priapulus caudatus TaxID=37621 RepID=A0ABM1EDA0_PRICU|nr:PREDICTED: UPF0691 protein C9orf116 homolog [Priapulus caudatus]